MRFIPIYLSSQRIATQVGSTYTSITSMNFVLADKLGSPYRLISATNTVVSTFKYKPWGEDRAGSGSDVVKTNTYSFTSQRGQDVLELYFYSARWYDRASLIHLPRFYCA